MVGAHVRRPPAAHAPPVGPRMRGPKQGMDRVALREALTELQAPPTRVSVK